MEDVAIKSVIIGTGIFVTLIILSLVFVSFNQMNEIYSLVQGTENSIHSQFDSYIDKYTDAYNNKQMTGLDMLNTLRMVEDEEEIKITITYTGKNNVKARATDNNMRESKYLKYLMDGSRTLNGVKYTYQRKYRTTVVDNGSSIEIKFTEIT